MHLIKIKILFLAAFGSFLLFAQTWSQAEHCAALDKKLESELQMYDRHTSIYLNHLKECRLPIENKFLFYEKLFSWLLHIPLLPAALEPLDKAVQFLLNETPPPDMKSLEKISLDPLEAFSEKLQTEEVVLKTFPSYHAKKSITEKQNLQRLANSAFRVREIIQTFSSPLSICKNTKEFQHLLNPLDSLLQEVVFNISQNINDDQLRLFQQLYVLYHSFQPQTLHHTSGRPPFISWTLLPPSFIDFISEFVDQNNSPFQKNYDWLKPLLPVLKIQAKVSTRVQSYCTPYQPFFNKEFVEHYYTVEFQKPYPPAANRRRELLTAIQENLATQNHNVIFQSRISSDDTRLHLYFIRHGSPPG